jgi:hypothetical protein
VDEKDIRERDVLSGGGGKSNHQIDRTTMSRLTRQPSPKPLWNTSVVLLVDFEEESQKKTYYISAKAEARKNTIQALWETEELSLTLKSTPTVYFATLLYFSMLGSCTLRAFSFENKFPATTIPRRDVSCDHYFQSNFHIWAADGARSDKTFHIFCRSLAG